MFQRLFALAFFVLGTLHVYGQDQMTLKGRVLGAGSRPVAGATVKLVLYDTIPVKTTVADDSGYFEISARMMGYSLRITGVGYKDAAFRVFLDTGKQYREFALTPADNFTKVTVTGRAPIASQKNDTVQYNADAFKTTRDANAEDLVGKMPGITTTDGKVQAQGEDVKQVLMDGRPVFGDDASAALRNLPAEVVEKIQVFDRRSDQAQFTGFDDGNSAKTINIITRAQFRNMDFGRMQAGAGYGTEDQEFRHKASVSLNRFRGKRRITLLGMSNNVNEQNFSADDLLGVMGSSAAGGMRGGMGGMRGGGMGMMGGGAAGGFMVDQRNGISSTASAGINYTDKWGEKTEVSASYFFNYSDNFSEKNTYRTYLNATFPVPDYSENSRSSAFNTNHRFNGKWEYRVDSLRSWLIQPRISLQMNRKNGYVSGFNLRNEAALSSTGNNSFSDQTGYNYSLPVLYRHGFRKRGRTLLFNGTLSGNKNDGTTRQNYLNTAYSGGIPVMADTFFQEGRPLRNSLNLNGNIQYTEPAGKRGQLQAGFTAGSQFSSNDRYTWRTNEAGSRLYTDTLLSNEFTTRYNTLSISGGYRYQGNNWNASAGVSGQRAILDNVQKFPDRPDVNREFLSLLPNAQLQWKSAKKQGRSLRLNYRTSNNAPSADQLQEVVNNSNPLQLSTGNAKLKQDFSQNLWARYSSVNSKTAGVFFMMFGGGATSNYIATETFIAAADTALPGGVFLRRGAQLTRPLNMKGNYSLRSFISYGVPVKKIKSNLNFNAGITWNRTPSMMNGRENFASNTALNGGIVISSNISKELDFTISTNSSTGNISYSIPGQADQRYFTQNSRFRLNLQPARWVVVAELTHQYNSGLSSGFNSQVFLATFSAGRKLLPSKALEFRLTVFDAFNGNNYVQRSFSDVYTEDVKYNVLSRYVLASLIFNLRAMPANANGPKAMPVPGMPGGMPHGHPGF